MIIINNLPVTENKFKKEKSEKIISGTIYSFTIPSCLDNIDGFYELLLDKHLKYKKNPCLKGREASSILYYFMSYDWYFSGVINTFEKDSALRYELKFHDTISCNVIIVETDVIEYGYIVALEIMSIINGDRNV